MRKKWNWFVLFGVVLTFFLVFSSCTTESFEQLTEEDMATLQAAMGVGFGELMELGEEDPLPSGITSEATEGFMTLTFTNYTNPSYPGITVNGSLTMSISGDENTFIITLTGNLTFTGTGAPVNTLGFNITITTTDPFGTPTVTISGYIAMDGTKYDASTLTGDDIPLPPM